MKKIKYMAIFAILLVSGNFLRLIIEDSNKPKVEISEESSYKKEEAKKENNLSGTKEKFDVNSVTFEELLKLGFSKSKATKVIEFREEMGIITDLNEFKNISRFGESGVKQVKKYLFVDNEKIKDSTLNYDGKEIKKYNINSLDENGLKLIGFSKKEIKGITAAFEKGNIYSNIDLEKIIGEKRYLELEKRIKFSD